MKKATDFLTGNIQKNLFTMVTPLFLAMCLTMMYNMVDSLWVGNLLGEQRYAALTSSTSLILILNAIAMGTGNGSSILISQMLGANKQKTAEELITTLLTVSLTVSVVITIVTEMTLPLFLQNIGTPNEIYNDAYAYSAIYLLGYGFFFVYMQTTSIFRSFGDSLFQMKGMLLATIFNAIIDPILICNMGLTGAAWATVFSELLCLLYAYRHYKTKKLFTIRLNYISISHIPELLKKAVPSALQQCMPAISSAIMVALVSEFGVITIAAYGVITKIEILLLYPAMAMNMALTAIIAQCAGAERMDLAKQYLKCACIYGSIIIGVLSAVTIFFSKQLSNLFVESDAVAYIVQDFFFIVSIGYICYMLTSSFLGLFSGIGKPEKSLLLMFVYYIIIRIPLAVVLVNSSLLVNGIWLAILVSHITAVGIAAVIFFYSPYRSGETKNI